MKKLFLIALLCLVPIQAQAIMPGLMEIWGGCDVCTSYYEYTTTGTAVAVGRNVDNEYVGGIWNDSAAGGEICQVDIYVVASPGAPVGNDYYVEIWTIDGSSPPHLDTVVGRSDKVDGVDAWSAEWVTFAFSSTYTYSQSTDYAFVVKAIDNDDPAATVGEYDETNYITIGYTDETSAGTKLTSRRSWKAAKTDNVVDAEDDIQIKVHTMQ